MVLTLQVLSLLISAVSAEDAEVLLQTRKAQVREVREVQDMTAKSALAQTFKDVCIHAAGDKPAIFELSGGMTVRKLIITHKSGGLTCRKGSHRSNFGCDHDSLGLVITKMDKEEVLMPLASTF